MSLSVIVLTKNEEERIKACLESVKWADEIIIADSGSTDKTLEIAKKYADKVIQVAGDGFSERRNKAFEKVTSEWVLYIDSDERVLEVLKEEIQQIMQTSQFSAYAISRRNIIFGSEERYGPFWPDWVIRLLKREDFTAWEGDIHEQPKFNGKLGYTKNSLLHLTHRDLDQVVMKSLEWSKLEAKLRFDSGHPKMSGWRFLRILISELFNQGLVRRGFFSGDVGMMDGILQTFSFYMTYVRLWEMQRKESLDETYKKIDQKLLEDGFKY